MVNMQFVVDGSRLNAWGGFNQFQLTATANSAQRKNSQRKNIWPYKKNQIEKVFMQKLKKLSKTEFFIVVTIIFRF